MTRTYMFVIARVLILFEILSHFVACAGNLT